MVIKLKKIALLTLVILLICEMLPVSMPKTYTSLENNQTWYNKMSFHGDLSFNNTNRTIYVDDDGGADYTKIQDAIDNATEGDIIVVYNGTYNENIVVNKKLNITGSGESNIIGIDDIEGGPVVLINKDWVTLSKFIIQGFFDSIVLSGVNYCQIINNHIINSERGIYLIESFDNVISNNVISNNSKYGIMFERCAHDLILINEFTSNENIAIFIYDSANSEIKRNTFRNNQVNAFIFNSPINYWEENYWDRARTFPKVIFGVRFIIPWVNFDWYPASEPYNW